MTIELPSRMTPVNAGQAHESSPGAGNPAQVAAFEQMMTQHVTATQSMQSLQSSMSMQNVASMAKMSTSSPFSSDDEDEDE